MPEDTLGWILVLEYFNKPFHKGLHHKLFYEKGICDIFIWVSQVFCRFEFKHNENRFPLF